MESRKFDPQKLAKLNDPKRLEYLSPDLIWDTLDPGDPLTVVDIGAGTGVFAVLFRGKMKGGRVYACDVSDTMVAWMKDNLAGELKDSVIPMKMEESSVPLTDGIADLVYMINLHHELDEPEKIVQEAYRLLRKGGSLAVIDWKKEETPEGPPLSIRVTAEKIEGQMKAAGFSQIRDNPILIYHSFVTGKK
ncbi:MAG: class I SAM-dependent methyltransferase [Candidatus Sulfobium sp.]|jgi:ubiquinone/menaquinone biosynthesis C-methylase UbiE